jgi:outer membrane protein OmpA-like peptidoglycan-associated protein
MKKILIPLMLLLFLGTHAYAYDLTHKFGLGASGGFPVPIFGNAFNDVNNAKWDASIYGRYHFNQSLGIDLGVSHEAFKGSSVKFNNANLLAFWRTAGASDITPVVGVGIGFTRIKNFDPASLKLSLLGRLGLEYGLCPNFSLSGLLDYQYVSKIMGDMPDSRAHVLNPQLALTWYFGGDTTNKAEKEAAPAPAEKVGMNDTDVVSVSNAATLRDQQEISNVTIDFDTNKATIKPEYEEQISKAADYLNNNTNAVAMIEGNADSRGTKKYNKKLSIKRANAVKEKLINLGVDQKRLSSKGFGSENPIADNNTVEVRRKNRRVDIIISTTAKLSDTM